MPLLLVHETDEARGGVATFGHFFGGNVTPAELLQLKLYDEIAIPLKARRPHAHVSVRFDAQTPHAPRHKPLARALRPRA